MIPDEIRSQVVVLQGVEGRPEVVHVEDVQVEALHEGVACASAEIRK